MKFEAKLIDEEAAESIGRWFGDFGKMSRADRAWNIWCVGVSASAIFIAGMIIAILTLFTESGTKAYGSMIEGAEFSMKGDGDES